MRDMSTTLTPLKQPDAEEENGRVGDTRREAKRRIKPDKKKFPLNCVFLGG